MPIDSSKSCEASKSNLDGRCQDKYGQIAEQELEEDDEMLDYSKFSQSRPSYVLNNNLQLAVNRPASNQQVHGNKNVSTNPDAVESSKRGSDPLLGSDPYGLNDRIDSSLLDSKLEPKEQL